MYEEAVELRAGARRPTWARPRCSSSTSGSSTTRAASTGTTSAILDRDRRALPRPHRHGAAGAGRRAAGGRVAVRFHPALARARVRRRVHDRARRPGAPRNARRPRDRPRRPAERRARHRGTPGQAPTRVLRADPRPGPGRPRDPAAGRPGRLPGAVSRGGPHRALRKRRPGAPGRAAAPGRQRRHGGLRVPVRAPACRIPPGFARSSTSGPSTTTSASRPSRSSSSCAATRASWRTRSSSTPGRRSSHLPDRYAEHLSAAVGVPYPRGDYLEDVDGGFYCTCYLRAWAFEAQLRDHLKSRFGSDWFRRRAAGDLLRELWSLGQSLRADDLLRELTGEPIRFGVLADEARAALG